MSDLEHVILYQTAAIAWISFASLQMDEDRPLTAFFSMLMATAFLVASIVWIVRDWT